jgi:hypothetical protein
MCATQPILADQFYLRVCEHDPLTQQVKFRRRLGAARQAKRLLFY